MVENEKTEDVKSETTASNQLATPIQSDKAVDRQNLIETAVRFLSNPKVVPTAIENKRLFLLKKGLTESEIEAALKKAGCYENNTKLDEKELIQQPSTISNQIEPISNSKIVLENKQTFWSRLIKWIKNLFLLGCFTYTAYKLLVKKFLLNGKSKPQTNMDKLLLCNQQLNESIKDMKTSLNSLKETVDLMNSAVKQISHKPSTSGLDESGIKNELQIIKNLFLSRTQFPSLPTVSPVLPSWQLETKNTNNSNKSSINNIKEQQEENEEEEAEEASKNINAMSKSSSSASSPNNSNGNHEESE